MMMRRVLIAVIAAGLTVLGAGSGPGQKNTSGPAQSADTASQQTAAKAKTPELLVQRVGDKAKSAQATVRYEVRVAESPGAIRSFGLDIVYDPALVRYASTWTRGSLTENFSQMGVKEVKEGRIRLGGFTVGLPVPEASDGVLVELTFEVISYTPSRLSVAAPVDDVKGFALASR